VSPSAGTRSWTPARVALLGVVVLYLGIVLVVPLAGLVARLADAGLSAIVAALSEEGPLEALWISLSLTAIAVVANGTFGIAAALVLVRGRFRGRKVLDALTDLPLAVSPVMTGLAFLVLFGRNGWLEPVTDVFGWKVTFAYPGLILATLFVTLPYTFREVAYVVAEIGTQEEEAATTLGASVWMTFWEVTLPNIRYGVAYGVLLTVARALGEFGAVLILGGGISGSTETATTFIYAALEERNEVAAYGMAAILASASIFVLLGLEWMRRRRA
jgi:sulfate/thiosulfate transport system permease protein